MRILSLLIAAALVAPLLAQTKPVRMPARANIDGWLCEEKVPVAGISLIENGKIKQTKVFGELKTGSTGHGTPAPDNTIFNVASLTKPVVAILTLRLVSMGKWSLDEPLSNYFVDPDVADDPRHRQLTTRLVLTHQTGLPNWKGNEPSKKLSFAFDPGTDVKYSGEGFQYLRKALEHKFHKTLQDLDHDYVFAPFGMKDTRHLWDRSMDESLYANRYNENGQPLEIEKWYEPHAANLLLTTVGDYSRFAVQVLKGAGLRKDAFADMVSPHPPPNAKSTKVPFGLCWAVVRDLSNGEYALVHTGRNPGIAAIVILLPRSKRGVVVLTNGENGDRVYKRIVAESLDIGAEILERLQ
jgi:CubicO group peptidase (beta-lactamase class C family)